MNVQRQLSTPCTPQPDQKFVRNVTTLKTGSDWMQSLCLEENRVPAFRLNGSQISVLRHPHEFYNAMMNYSSVAEKRITLASLYLGTDKLEKDLVDTIHTRLGQCQETIKLRVLLDHTRGSRGNVNSRTMLLPTVKEFPENADVNFYHTPYLRGVVKQLVPPKMNETVSVTHLKVYLFDDTLIMSGANLSHDYFTNRQDRYVVFKDCKDLCDYFDDLVNTVSQFSLKLQQNGDTTVRPACCAHPYTGDQEAFINYASQMMDAFITKYANRTDQADEQMALVNEKDGQCLDTVVYPLLQMDHYKVDQDSKVTCQLLTNAPENSKLCLATAYLNMPPLYWNCVLSSSAAIDIMMAHPEAMGFHGASGIIGRVPNVYTLIAEELYHSVQEQQQSHRVKMSEYLRANWTFHGKGLWAIVDDMPEVSVTLIGSPNFGYRSVYRDLEAQVLLTTTNVNLRKTLEEERKDFYLHCSAVSQETFEQRTSPLWVKLFKRAIYSYF